MFSKEEHLEAAKLAKAIGSQLGIIDSYSVERTERPANQIDINRFIAQVVEPSRKAVTNSSGYMPEELIQKMIPEPEYKFAQPTIQEQQVDLPVKNGDQQIHKKQNFVNQQPNNTPEVTTSCDIKTWKRIASSLEKIAKSYEKYVDCYVVSSKLNKNTNILNE